MVVIFNMSCIQKTRGVTILLQGWIGKANVPLSSHPMLVPKGWVGTGIPQLFNVWFWFLALESLIYLIFGIFLALESLICLIFRVFLALESLTYLIFGFFWHYNPHLFNFFGFFGIGISHLFNFWFSQLQLRKGR